MIEGFFFLYVIAREGRAVYVGQTQNPKRRWSDHQSSARGVERVRAITNALRKYGVEAFTFEVLPVVFESQWAVDQAEVHLIAALRTGVDFGGYNTSKGGLFNRPSLEALARMAASKAGKPLAEEHRQKLARAARARPKATQEMKDRMSAAQIARWAALTPEQRLATSKNRKARWEKRRKGAPRADK